MRVALRHTSAGERGSWRDRIASLRGIWPFLFLFGVIIGGLYANLFTATEAGAAASVRTANTGLEGIARGVESSRVWLKARASTATGFCPAAMVFRAFGVKKGCAFE
mgnify:CR=1 FL=1